MPLTTVSATLKLDNILSPPQAVVTDTTNYAGQGVLTTDCNGYIKLTVNTATGPIVFYDNIGGATPDITPSTGLTNNIAIPLPLDTGGKAIQGDYTLVYQVVYIDSAGPPSDPPVIVSVTNNYSYSHTLPEVCIKVEINCQASTVTSTDITEYGAYVTTIVRTHTIFPDPLLHIPNKVGTVAKLIYNDIGTGNWGSEVSSVVTWTFPDGLIVTDTIVGCIRYVIQCNTNLCKIFCCLKESVDNWASLKSSGQLAEAERIRVMKLEPAFMYAELFLMAINCGKKDDTLDELYELIKKTSGCSEECCSDDCPTMIIPVTGEGCGCVVVDSPDGTVTVTEEIIDGTTYYHLHIDPPRVPTVIVQGIAPIVVTSVVAPNGDTIYTVAFSGTLPVQINELDITGAILPSGPTWTFIPTYVVAKGANMIDPAVTPHAYYLGSNEPTLPAPSDFVCLHYSGYQVTPGPYTVQANVMTWYTNDSVATIKTKLAAMKSFEAEVFYVDNSFAVDDFFIRLYSVIDGHPIRFEEIFGEVEPFELILRIQVISQTA